MITAIVLIDCATDSIPEEAEALADLPGVSEVYSVAGNVDLIAVVRVREFDEIADVIAGRISKVPGVINTESTPNVFLTTRFTSDEIGLVRSRAARDASSDTR